MISFLIMRIARDKEVKPCPEQANVFEQSENNSDPNVSVVVALGGELLI